MYSNYLGACVSRFGRVFIMKKNLKTIVLLQEYLMRNVKLAITMVNTEIIMVITEISMIIIGISMVITEICSFIIILY